MNSYGKRIIDVRTPVVLYDQSCGTEQTLPKKSMKSLREKIFEKGVKTVSFHRKTNLQWENSKSIEKIPILNSRDNTSTRSIRKLAVIKKTNMRLEGFQLDCQKLSTYKQILDQIKSRFSKYKQTNSRPLKKFRNYSYDNKAIFRSYEEFSMHTSMLSQPKRKSRYDEDSLTNSSLLLNLPKKQIRMKSDFTRKLKVI